MRLLTSFSSAVRVCEDLLVHDLHVRGGQPYTVISVVISLISALTVTIFLLISPTYNYPRTCK